MAYASDRGMGRGAKAVLIALGTGAVFALASFAMPTKLLALGQAEYALAAAALGVLIGIAPAILLTRPNEADLLEWAGDEAGQDDAASANIPAPLAQAGHDARRPLSVYDVIGLNPEEVDAAEEVTLQTESHEDLAPPFVGAPPLPGVSATIAALHQPKYGLGGRFGKPEPETADYPPATEPEPAPPASDTAGRADLATLSFLQLTERLAQAMAANPLSPRDAAPREAAPPIDRLRHFEAATAQARRRNSFLSDDIRDVLADLDQIRGVA